MKRLFLSILMITFSGILNAQLKLDNIELRPKNNAYVTIGGADGALISFNYERLFLNSEKFFITAKIGAGYNEQFRLCIFGPCSTPTKKYFVITQHITTNFGKGRSFFEAGLGSTIIGGVASTNFLIYPILAYRFQPLVTNKTLFRISVGFLLFNYKNIDLVFIPIGISVGLCF